MRSRSRTRWGPARRRTGSEPRDVRVVVDIPAPRMFGSRGQADAHAVTWTAGRSQAVIDDDDALVSGHEVGAIVGAVETERLAQLRGAAAQISVAGSSRS